MKKTIVSLLLVALLALTSVAGLAEGLGLPEIPEVYALPIEGAENVPQLKMYLGTEAGYEKAYLSYDEHVAIIEWENRVGLDFTFVHPPLNDDGTFFNTVISSGQLPDIMISSFSNYLGGVEGAIGDGVLVNLDDYILQYGHYYLTEAHKNWDAQAAKNFKTDSGMYRFGAASQRVPVLGMQHSGFVVREDLLDQAGLDMPETIGEFTEMLKAFKELGVEEPLVFEKLSSSYIYGNGALTSHLGVNSNTWMYDEEGKVTYAMIEDNYVEWLKLLNSWYNDGLISIDCISRTHSDAEAVVTSGRGGVVAFGNWETQENIAVGKAAVGEEFNLLGMPVLAADEDSVGEQYNIFASPIVNGENTNYFGITTTNPAPVESFKALDYLYSYEGVELMVFGPETAVDQLHREDGNVVDIHWTEADGKRQFSEYILNNPELEYNSIRYIYTIQGLSTEYASEMEYMQYGEECNAQCWEAWTANYDVAHSRRLPNALSLTAEEASARTVIMTEVETFIYEKINQIVFGQDSIENWPTYVQQLYDMGIEDAIAITQAATDRYNAR